MVLTVQKTMEILQLQLIDKVFDVSVVQVQQVRVQSVRRQVELPQLQPVEHGHRVQKTVTVPQLQYSDRVVDVPVGAVHRRIGRPCDHAATLCCDIGSAPDSVHRQSQWTFQFATERSTRLSAVVVMAAMKGVFGLFRPFFALLQVVWS